MEKPKLLVVSVGVAQDSGKDATSPHLRLASAPLAEHAPKLVDLTAICFLASHFCCLDK